jgi:uncharacterized protein with HEPN domain
LHSDKKLSLLHDIVENAERIEGYVHGISFIEFAKNQLIKDAVERCFQRITEASIQLGADAAKFFPSQDTPAMRQFGNILRHEYRLDRSDFLWEFIELDLPSLKHDCEKLLDQNRDDVS